MVRSFLDRFRQLMDKHVEGIAPEAMAQLEAYDWPGNVRELENTMERSVALESGRLISFSVLPEKIRYAGANSAGPEAPKNGKPAIGNGGVDLEQHVRRPSGPIFLPRWRRQTGWARGRLNVEDRPIVPSAITQKIQYYLSKERAQRLVTPPDPRGKAGRKDPGRFIGLGDTAVGEQRHLGESPLRGRRRSGIGDRRRRTLPARP